jgi:hydrogenase-4 component E
MSFLTALLLLSAFLLTRVSSLRMAVKILAAQSLVVSFACVWSAMEVGSLSTYVAAFLTVVVKAIVIPYALMRVILRLRDERERRPILSMNKTTLAAALVLAVSYGIIDHALPGIGRDVLSGAMALLLIGLLLMITRRQAVMQIVGLITMENGMYLLGLSMTRGLPMVIELGIVFDILVAVVVLGLMTWRLKLSFKTTDTSVLRKLKG